MYNYSQSNKSRVENKKKEQNILEIKQKGKDKINYTNDNHKSMVINNFQSDGNKRSKEMNNETIYDYNKKYINNKSKENRDISRGRETERTNMINRKVYNNISNLKKKIHYDKPSANNTGSASNNKTGIGNEYAISQKNTTLSDNTNKNYSDKKNFDNINIGKDKPKFRKIYQYNEDNNKNANNVNSGGGISNNNYAYNDMDNTNEIGNNRDKIRRPHRYFNDPKSVNNNNISNIGKNKKGNSNINCESPMNPQNYEYNKRNNNETYESMKQRSAIYGPGADSNNPGSGAANNANNNVNSNANCSNNTFSYSKLNRNYKNKYEQYHAEMRDHSSNKIGPIGGGESSESRAGAMLYLQRDKMYHRNACELKNKNNVNNKDNFNSDDTEANDGLINEEIFLENKNKMNDANNNMNGIGKYSGETLEDERHPNNIGNIKRGIYPNYNGPKNDINNAPNKNGVDKDGNRKKEYHTFSFSTIDSNCSNKNILEKKMAKRFLGEHLIGGPENSKENMNDEKKKNIGTNENKNDGDMYIGQHNNTVNCVNDNDGNGLGEYNKQFSEYNHNNENAGNNNISGNEDNMGNTKFGENTKNSSMNRNGYMFKENVNNSRINKNANYVDIDHKNTSNFKNYDYNVNDNITPDFDKHQQNMGYENKMQKGNHNLMHNNNRNMKRPNIKNINQYNALKYDDRKELRKFSKNVDMKHINKNGMNYNNVMSDDEYRGYHLSDSYENTIDDINMDPNEYNIRPEKSYYNNMNYKYNQERNIKRNCYEPIDNYKNSYLPNNHKKYLPELYDNMDNTPERPLYDDYRNDEYIRYNGGKQDEMRKYRRSHSYDSLNANKDALTIIRLPAEKKKQVKKKKKSIIGNEASLVEMYSTAIPISEKLDPYALKALSKNENLREKVYALIPKSVVEITEHDDITHVTLQSPSSLFVNQNKNIKHHIITTNFNQNTADVPSIATCAVGGSADSIKESLEKSKDSLSSEENDKNLKSIIRGISMRNKTGSSLNVKFKLSQNDYDNKSGNKNENNSDEHKYNNEDCYTELNKKIEDHILSEELKNLKIDKKITERKRASIFDETKIKTKSEKKNDINNKMVLDSSKVKNATEIKLKKIQYVTGLLEKYNIPNPFDKYVKEPIDYSQLEGQTNNAKLFNLALRVSDNYFKYIMRSMEEAEIKEVFNEKRKKMILKLIALLGGQIHSEIKKVFSQENVPFPLKEEKLKKEEKEKPKISAKEKEIKIEEHNLMCKYWTKQSECMSLLINEWNKISEILESINVDPNNMINSLISIYGEQAVRSFNLSVEELKNSNIELDVNIDDIPIPDIGDNNENKFDSSNMTILNLIQDIKWDMDIEYSLNQIREDWKTENLQTKRVVQKKVIEGIKHRIGLLDYLNKAEMNLNAFSKIIEERLISNDDVKSQLRSMQNVSENMVLSKLLENLEYNTMDINPDAFKTPTSFFVSHHLPMTIMQNNNKSNTDETLDNQQNNTNSNLSSSNSIDNYNSNNEDDKNSGNYGSLDNESINE
ncbi:conserved Plasmodium protein, unknown function [Plasmodium vinckei lentum]|uniref:Uncharacterized protein n=1 Tax=Plasmodium vinckei lentum TaxID=138297 RepID=A0A6V7S109_PLAVN|nr:conserved Plasmodium protein, unknown function [Plasmodium vinckei lentum]